MLNQLLDHRYKVVSHLGSGGFGTTFLAQDTKRPGSPFCVVKQLTPSKNTSNFLALSRRLFNTEAETLENLGKHPQIPQLLAYFEENQEFYLVQEYINGNPLKQELVTGQKWSEIQVIDLLEDILSILKFVHDNNTIHRDVKPDNIIRRRSDQKFVLVDFGAVKIVRHPDDISSTVAIGTPGYISGEQAIGKPRPSSDIYALGIIAIQALTGLNPSPNLDDTDTGFSYDQNTGEIVWLDKVAINPSLGALIAKMVKPSFPDRYKSVDEVLADLKTLRLNHYGDLIATEPLSISEPNHSGVAAFTKLPPSLSEVQNTTQPPSITGNTLPKASPTEADLTKASPTEADLTKTSPTEADLTKTSPTEVALTKASPTEANLKVAPLGSSPGTNPPPTLTAATQVLKTAPNLSPQPGKGLPFILIGSLIAGTSLILWRFVLPQNPSPNATPTPISSPTSLTAPSVSPSLTVSPTPSSIASPSPTSTATPTRTNPPGSIPHRSTPIVTDPPVPIPAATPVPIPAATPVPIPAATPIPIPAATPAPLPTVPGGIESTPVPPE
jgi:serine/threonine protein kinase